MSITQMVRQIDTLVDKECGIGATDQEIINAERTLDVHLPHSYKAFLSRFGWVRVHCDPVFGVGRSVPTEYGLVETTLSERYEAHPHIPHHLVPIMNDGAGNNYCLDTSHFHDDECPIVFWDHEHEDGPDQTPQQVSASFDRWLIDRIADSPYADNS
jgi:hypothetical protein